MKKEKTEVTMDTTEIQRIIITTITYMPINWTILEEMANS